MGAAPNMREPPFSFQAELHALIGTAGGAGDAKQDISGPHLFTG